MNEKTHARRTLSVYGWLAAAALLLGGPLGAVAPAPVAAAGTVIRVVASTNVYGNVVAQLGGTHVQVTSILSDPNTDPHTYESSTANAGAVARATLVVQNGLGYDDFITNLEAASPNAKRVVIDAGAALGYKNGENPHIWYNPATMPRVAGLVVAALVRQDPADAHLFQANLRAFDASLKPWTSAISAIKQRFGGTPVAVTEPVFDYTLQAMDLKILTPYAFQAAIMEGFDPAPQDVMLQENLFTGRKVKLFCYNQQAVAPITRTLLSLAGAHHVPIVGVYETRPVTKSYQQWMLAEVRAVRLALTSGVSTLQIR